MIRQVIKRNGKRFVMIEECELRRLEKLAAGKSAPAPAEKVAFPAFPPADEHGNRPAIEFARVSLARSFIEDRTKAGLSQQELARLAGVRQETISRIESGKHSPTVRTVEKIDRVLQNVLQKRKSIRGNSSKA